MVTAWQVIGAAYTSEQVIFVQFLHLQGSGTSRGHDGPSKRMCVIELSEMFISYPYLLMSMKSKHSLQGLRAIILFVYRKLLMMHILGFLLVLRKCKVDQLVSSAS